MAYTRCSSIIGHRLLDPADPDGVESGASSVVRRDRTVEVVDDPVHSEIECVQLEDAPPCGLLVSAEVIHVDRSGCDFDEQVGLDDVLPVDDGTTATVRAVEGVQVAIVVVNLGVRPPGRGTYDEREVTSISVLVLQDIF